MVDYDNNTRSYTWVPPRQFYTRTSESSVENLGNPTHLPRKGVPGLLGARSGTRLLVSGKSKSSPRGTRGFLVEEEHKSGPGLGGPPDSRGRSVGDGRSVVPRETWSDLHGLLVSSTDTDGSCPSGLRVCDLKVQTRPKRR